MDSGGRILVVDDEPTLRAVIAEALAAEGYEVREAADGARALELLRREPVDAIVLDLMMPNVDGWALLRHTKADGHGPIGIVTMSAVMDQRASERLRALGVRYCLAKPFDIDDLIACVARVLGTSGTDKKISDCNANSAGDTAPGWMVTHDPSAGSRRSA